MTKKNSTDDESLFRATVGKVRSVDTNSVVLKPDKKPRPYPVAKALERVDPFQNRLDDRPDTVYQEDSVAFISPGLQKAVLRKLRKGFFGLDAEIDLHGLTSRDAHQQLLAFLHHCVEDGCRCVKIVHGKGYHSPDNQPVLKNDMNFWLRQHKDVLAFCSAPSREGGAGALLVLLRLSDKFDDDEENIHSL